MGGGNKKGGILKKQGRCRGDSLIYVFPRGWGFFGAPWGPCGGKIAWGDSGLKISQKKAFFFVGGKGNF